jgi:hypothetical protein
MVVPVLDLSVLDWDEIMRMLLRKDLAVSNWLNRGVIVVLVDLFIDGCLNLFMGCWLDCLACYRRRYFLVYGGVVVTGLVHEVTDCLLGFIH